MVTRLLAWLLVAITCALAPVAFGQETEYRRGYVDALLNTRFPGLGLRVHALDAGGLRIHSGVCLGPQQRRDITQLLQETVRPAAIAWDKSADCRGDAELAEPPPATIQIRALPERPLFAPLIADPRQPRFSTSYQRYQTPTQRFDAGNVAFGEYFGLANRYWGRSGHSQVGIQGAVFALFNLDAPSSDLVNADYWIGIPWSFRRGHSSYLLRVYHQSSHLGDEFLLGNPGIDRVNLSYEDVEALVSYEWERVRAYAGGSYIIHSEPDIAPRRVHGGLEFVKTRAVKGLDFIAAADVRAAEELDWRSSHSYQAGFEFRNGSTRRLRLMLEYFRGHSPSGQFYREKLHYSGIGLYFGF